LIEAIDILSYLQGSAAPEVRKKVNDWIYSSPENTAEFEKYEQVYFASTFLRERQYFDRDTAWAGMTKRLGWEENAGDNPSSVRKSSKVRRIPASWAVAASIALLAIVGWLFYEIPTREIWVRTWADPQEVVLADATVAELGPYSHLLTRSHFEGETARIVYMSGLVHMAVQHDPDQPMLVIGDLTGTKVLGTEFNLESNANRAMLENISGLLEFYSLEDPENSVILHPGDKVTFDGTEFAYIDRDTTEAPAAPARPVVAAIPVADMHDREDILTHILSLSTEVFTLIPYRRGDTIPVNLNQSLQGIFDQLDTTSIFEYGPVRESAGTRIKITRFEKKR
jgi:ferric-dicitrate binding protein FerR (iron transport regulator)